MGSWCCSITSTHYILRGGSSNYGTYCGTFFIYAYSTADNGAWRHGAALSFKPFSTHYPTRGDHSNHGNFCGILAICIIYSAAFTNNSWLYGAALSFIYIYTLCSSWWSF